MTSSHCSLTAPLTALRGVGPRLADKLARLGLETVQDLLFHLPLRYQDRTRLTPIGSLRPGDTAQIEGTIELAQLRFGRRRSLLVRLADGSGAIWLRFFHFSRSQQAQLQQGQRLRCFGEVRQGKHASELVHPEYQLLGQQQQAPVAESLTPIYPTTEGLQQGSLRKLIEQALDYLSTCTPPDLLLEDGHNGFGFSLGEALLYLHRPPADADIDCLLEGRHPAQQRLAFEELLAHQVSIRQMRQRQNQRPAPVLNGDGHLRTALLQTLPFELTAAQQRVVAEVETDLSGTQPMLRLVQGDVGSGKTVVAMLAALQALEAGYQVAVMAPTELLAEQHRLGFEEALARLDIDILWLASRIQGSLRQQTLERLQQPQPLIAIGTHALFQDEVRFARLGLVIVDEQHRFGVHQRLALRDKGQQEGRYPHQLIMTATPIPRTLAMTAYADLDTSIIDELPPGRQAITTTVLSNERREELIERIAAVCAEGRQVYWVCPLIEESEQLECQAATETSVLLDEALPEVSVGLVHGRMKATEKAASMAAFASAEVQLLVATTVIEVGVNVPNASLMIIENAERLGLAQLHQLRGRVGRGDIKSDCLLMYRAPLSALARERLQIMRASNDGFQIAERDLQLRGPGELLGTRQSGLAQLRIADLRRDAPLLTAVRAMAARLIAGDQQRCAALIHRWLGDAIHYGHV